MKRWIRCTTLLLTIALSGCIFNTDEPYEFRQALDQIVTIEILRKEYDSVDTDTPMNVIHTIDPSSHKDFVDDLLKIEGGRVGLEPGTGFGMYIICITYKDGEKEMIGDYNNGYITSDGEVHQDIYAFDTEQYYAFISELLGEKITDYYYH